MRNPFESMVSYRKLEIAGKLENPDEKEAFNTSKWASFKSTEIGSWYRHAISYLKHPNNKMHVIQYDDLVKDTRKGNLFLFYLFQKEFELNLLFFWTPELTKLLEFLEFPFDPERLECTLKYKKGKFQRKSSKSMILFPFTKEEVILGY